MGPTCIFGFDSVSRMKAKGRDRLSGDSGFLLMKQLLRR